MNNQNNEKHVLILSGLTEKEIEKDAKRYKKVRRRCYVCGRADGEASVALDRGDKTIVSKTIDLIPILRRSGQTSMVYQLCSECLILLKIGDEDQFEQKQEGVFIPICRN